MASEAPYPGRSFPAGRVVRISADYPRGDAMILCDGILRLRYAEEPDGMARRKRMAVNTVFADAGRPSRVVLPLTFY